jgi:nucleotide-binding universal stress UspA family protein
MERSYDGAGNFERRALHESFSTDSPPLPKVGGMEKLLVPVDGSECSLHALDVAVQLAKSTNAEIVLCQVVDPGRAAGMTLGESQLIEGCFEALEAEGDAILEEATKRAGSGINVTSRKCEGAPIAQIVQLAAEVKPAFIVMGSHGRSGFNRLFNGSVAEGVARLAGVPVMIVPRQHVAAVA